MLAPPDHSPLAPDSRSQPGAGTGTGRSAGQGRASGHPAPHAALWVQWKEPPPWPASPAPCHTGTRCPHQGGWWRQHRVRQRCLGTHQGPPSTRWGQAVAGRAGTGTGAGAVVHWGLLKTAGVSPPQVGVPCQLLRSTDPMAAVPGLREGLPSPDQLALRPGRLLRWRR